LYEASELFDCLQLINEIKINIDNKFFILFSFISTS
jgi:hypothetical protein